MKVRKPTPANAKRHTQIPKGAETADPGFPSLIAFSTADYRTDSQVDIGIGAILRARGMRQLSQSAVEARASQTAIDLNFFLKIKLFE